MNTLTAVSLIITLLNMYDELALYQSERRAEITK